MIKKLKSFLTQSIRVWHILKKPTKKEFETTAKVSAIGIGIVGLLGFLVSVIMKIFV